MTLLETTGELPNSPGWKKKELVRIVGDTFDDLRSNLKHYSSLTLQDRQEIEVYLQLRQDLEIAKIDRKEGLYLSYEE